MLFIMIILENEMRIEMEGKLALLGPQPVILNWENSK